MRIYAYICAYMENPKILHFVIQGPKWHTVI